MGGDLHCHTKLSDGSLGIEDLVLLAKKKGIETIAITDHDCLAGTVRGKIIGDRYGVNVIPGVELSSRDEKTGKYVDILCYLSDAPDRLQGLCHKNSLARKKAAHFMMLQITKRYPVSAEFIIKCATGSTNIFIPHIMQALMESGYTNTIFGDLYNKLFNKESDGNILVTPKYPDIEEVVGAIHDAGGIAVLAHPYLYENIDSIPRLIECGIDGIEVWHPSATDADIEMLGSICKKHKLLMTGGSDFHGIYGSSTVTLGTCTTPDEHLDKLMGYKAKKKRAQRKAEKEALANAAKL